MTDWGLQHEAKYTGLATVERELCLISGRAGQKNGSRPYRYLVDTLSRLPLRKPPIQVMLLLCKSQRRFEWWCPLALIRSRYGDIVIFLLPYRLTSQNIVPTRQSCRHHYTELGRDRQQQSMYCNRVSHHAVWPTHVSRLVVRFEMFTVTHMRPRWAHVYLMKLDSIWSVYKYPTPWNKLYLFTPHHSNPKPAHRTLPNAGGLVLDRANWKMNARLQLPLVPASTENWRHVIGPLVLNAAEHGSIPEQTEYYIE